jgi:hypothetical protein
MARLVIAAAKSGADSGPLNCYDVLSSSLARSLPLLCGTRLYAWATQLQRLLSRCVPFVCQLGQEIQMT